MVSFFVGFAINIELLLNSTHVIPISSKPGYVEDAFLRQFVTVEELEPKADSCKKVQYIIIVSWFLSGGAFAPLGSGLPPLGNDWVWLKFLNG